MIDVFHSPRLTFERAQHHIREFKSTVRDFVDSKPYTYIVDDKSDLALDIHKIKFTREVPRELPCVLFDAANNLRAVLDQSGYAAALAAKRPLKSVKFPFGPTDADFRNNVAGGCKDLPPEIRAIFERCNAYERGNGVLWALNEIANTNR